MNLFFPSRLEVCHNRVALMNPFQILIFFSHFEFNKLQWLYTINLNLVLMCVRVYDTNLQVWIMPEYSQ